ncbi:uncharacterized protein LOC106518350 [Austrofundulus limnaeus]|uniref:Uncharacterized protein LOC106518350 n=1 Tax=Austrofundulus limnaeus TaxID=52670 RepID=A0A2I4BBD2_AUSLI|nr:PREDICTED: uncharacterized protein LOC106518350 [Austrofundulus limnaeus]
MQQTSTPMKSSLPKFETPEKVVKLTFPEYVLHTDTELEQVRHQYFELSKKGEERNCEMSKELRCHLIRNTMTSMIAILRAKGDAESHRYPSKPEITAMAKRIVLYYPMLQDQGLKNSWVTVFAQLTKRLQNVRSPQKQSQSGRQSKSPCSSSKRRHLDEPYDTDEAISSDSTIILDQSTDETSTDSGSNDKEFGKTRPQSPQEEALPLLSSSKRKTRPQSPQEEALPLLSSSKTNRPTDVESSCNYSPAISAKHYRTLQSLYKKRIQTTRMCLIFWIWNFKPEEHSLIQIVFERRTDTTRS